MAERNVVGRKSTLKAVGEAVGKGDGRSWAEGWDSRKARCVGGDFGDGRPIEVQTGAG